MPRLTLHLFGPPRLELDGQPVVTDRRKALALLVYLSINDLDYTREALATLLWPDQDTSHVLAYLRRTLWEISQAFGPDWVRTERDIVGLYPDARSQMWIDVSRFRTLVAQSRARDSQQDIVPLLEEAVELYRADFLAGFNLKDASLYEEWVSAQAEMLKRDYFLSLDALTQALARRGELDKAIEIASTWAACDSLNEAAHGRLMELYIRNGQGSAGIRQYQECARILMRELGIEPSSEIKTLFEKLKKEVGQKIAATGSNVRNISARQTLPESTHSTSFFGRRNELGELEKMLLDAQARLISILGPGGVGKTRLALEAGRIHSPVFADGACFVSLAAVSRPEYVVSSIADALGARFSASEPRSHLDQLAEFLARRHLLLILDNLEHLQVGARAVPNLIETLLKTAPRLKMMVTSHERLNLEQEWVLNVGGMPVPPTDAHDWEQYGAVQLFIQNARKAAGTLRLGEADQRAIIRICQLVGGLPLGLELAAAWARMLSCEEIAGEIEHGLDFLKTPLKNVVKRHQSLRATFEYSWNFLSEPEQQALMRLAIFRGGFKREMAQSVADAPLSTLTELGDKSFIQRDEAGRFDMHQALKPFVHEKLSHHPAQQAETIGRHSAYFAAFTDERRLALRGHGQRAALDDLTIELDNVLSGWGWAISQGSENDVQTYFEGLFRYFDLRNRFHDGESLFRGAVEQWQARFGSENVVFGLLLACHAWFCNRLSRIAQAHQLLLRSLELLRRLGARPQLMFANSLALYVVPMIDNMAEIERIAQESLAYYQEQNDRWGMAQVLPFFHRVKTPQGLQDAIRLHNQTLEIYRETGDSAGLAATLTSLGELLHYAGDYENARRCHQSALEIARELNDRRAIAANLDYLGFINRQMGDFGLSRRQHQESLEISRELDNQLGIAGSLDNLGIIDLDQRNYPAALHLFQEALPLRRKSGQLGSVAISLEHIATAALKLGDLCLAEASLQEAFVIFSHEPEWAMVSHTLTRLGDLELSRGNFAAAETHYRASLKQAREHESITIILDAALCLASCADAQGNPIRAVELAAYVSRHPASEYALKEQAREKLAELQLKLDEKAVADAIARGQNISLSELSISS